MIRFIKKIKGYNINLKELEMFAEKILKNYGKEKEDVTVLLCGNRLIKKLNMEYLSKNRPTDVISFPINEILEDRRYLGDIAISVPYALKSAKKRGEILENELKKLLIHGILHLLGWDHEKDSGEMRKEERKLKKIMIE